VSFDTKKGTNLCEAFTTMFSEFLRGQQHNKVIFETKHRINSTFQTIVVNGNTNVQCEFDIN